MVLAFARSPGAGSDPSVPLRTLAAFERTKVLAAGGGEQRVTLLIKARDILLVGEDGEWAAAKGRWTIEVGQLVVVVVVVV